MYIPLWQNPYWFQILSLSQWWSHINFLVIIRVLTMTRIGAVDGRDNAASRGCSGWYVVTAVSMGALVITAEDNGNGGAGRIDRNGGLQVGWPGDGIMQVVIMVTLLMLPFLWGWRAQINACLLTDTHLGRMLVFTCKEVWSPHWRTPLLQGTAPSGNMRPPEDLLPAGVLEEA